MNDELLNLKEITQIATQTTKTTPKQTMVDIHR